MYVGSATAGSGAGRDTERLIVERIERAAAYTILVAGRFEPA